MRLLIRNAEAWSKENFDRSINSIVPEAVLIKKSVGRSTVGSFVFLGFIMECTSVECQNAWLEP